MLEALKFVQGAVAKKDFVATLTHFRIADGLVKGFNGKMALCSPIDLDLVASPKATPFIKAIQTCRETTVMNLTKTGRLSIKSGKFRALVPCAIEDFPTVEPEGEILELDGELLPSIKKIAPFIAEDASRPWARGILFRNGSAYATNNIVIIQHWLGYDFPKEVNIPQTAIKELLRIKEEPTHIQMTDTSITFHYKSGAWLKTQTYETKWPDFDKFLNVASEQKDVNPEMFDGLEDIKDFVDETDRAYLLGDKIATSELEENSTTYEVGGLPERACFNRTQLCSLSGLITHIDLEQYPKPALFTGDKLRGAIVGIKI